jgi:hypothetical protein
MPESRSHILRVLSLWLGIAVVVELVLLRTGTRTLVHIPGLGRYELSIGILTEAGRFAFYLAALLAAVVLVYLTRSLWLARTPRDKTIATLISVFLLGAALGRMGWVGSSTVGWLSLCVLVGLAAVMCRGVRSIPVVLFVAASVSAAFSVLAQGPGGGVSGQTVDTSILAAEALLILSGLTSPLLITGNVPKGAWVACVAVFAIIAAGFSIGGSTLAILTLWNLGVPGWFPPLAYGIACGGLTMTLWTTIANRETLTSVGLILMVGGGVGMISTYQTALAIAAVTILGLAHPRAYLTDQSGIAQSEPSSERDQPAVV